jgi:capsular exopolysaccharide synthesis family protein
MQIQNSIIEQYNNASPALHDAIKTLRTNISFSSMDKEIKTIVVTSVMPQDGKSSLTLFLGIAMAEGGQRTLVIDCDCRRPMLQNYLKVRPQYSLVDVLSKRVGVDEAIVHTGCGGLDLLSTVVLANPVEVLGSKRFRYVIDDLTRKYDIILLDMPPLGSFIEAAILAAYADGTLLVLKSGRSDATAAQAVVTQLEKAQARILGVALNAVDMSHDDYTYSDYYYRDANRKRKTASEAGKYKKRTSLPDAKKRML